MFASFAPFALFALALASSVSAAPIPKRNVEVRAAPSGWATNYLEAYDVYHTRYSALSCQTQHDTTFFDECCHPLLATETLAGNRPAQCTPSTVSSAAVETFAPSTTAAATAAPAATTSASEEEEEECEVEESSSAVATSSAAATSSAVATSSTESVAAPATTQDATTTAEVAAAVVAPTTTAAAVKTTTKAAHTTTTAEPAPTTTTAEAAATTTAAASSGSENTGGYATYFLQNGNAGACGNVNSDDTPLVAITSSWWGGGDNFSSVSDLCGKYVNIKRVDTGATVTAIIADACPSCVNANSLDLSVGAFTSIASESEGMVSIEWSIVN